MQVSEHKEVSELLAVFESLIMNVRVQNHAVLR